MGTTSRLGSCSVLWRYRTPLVGRDLATMNNNVLLPGVYSGLETSIQTASLLKVTKGDALIKDSTGEGLFKIMFAEDFYASIDTLNGQARFLVLRYTWLDLPDNYPDVFCVETVEENDLILAVIEYKLGSSSWEIDRVDASSKSKGLNDLVTATYNNLGISIDFNLARTLTVNQGTYIYDRAVQTFAGGMATFASSTNPLGRWDFLGVTSNGIYIRQGVEGGGPPEIGDFCPVALVHIRQDMDNFLGTDVQDARPFLFYLGSGYVRYQDLQNGYDNAYGTTVPAQLTTIDVIVSGTDALVTVQPQSGLTNLLCYHAQVSPDGVTWYPPVSSGYSESNPGGIAIFWTPSMQMPGFPHAILNGAATPKTYYVRVRQLTTANDKSPWSDPIQFATKPIDGSALAGSVVTDAHISQSSLVARSASNFNSRNDRIATVPTAPTFATDGTAIDHTANVDASVNVSVEWLFTIDPENDATDIDGFIISVFISDSAVDHTFGTDPAFESTYYVTPDRRAFIMYGSPRDKYYTFAVQAYRTVDTDINSFGILKSAYCLTSIVAEKPYYTDFGVGLGDIGSTVTTPAALTVLDVTAPSTALAAVTAVAQAAGSILVSWSGFVDSGVGILGFKVWREEVGVAGSSRLLKEPLSNESTYADLSVAVGTAYRYAVSAYDRNGNECPKVYNASNATVATVSPSPVTNLIAQGYPGHVEITFDRITSPFLDYYQIEVSRDSGATWSNTDTLYSTTNTVRDYNVTVSIALVRYKVTAWYTGTILNSATSAVIAPDGSSFSASGSTLPAPILTADITDIDDTDANGALTPRWPDRPDAQYVRVYRKKQGTSLWLIIAQAVQASAGSFTDSTAIAGNSYAYALRTIAPTGAMDTTAIGSLASGDYLSVDTTPPVVPPINISPLIGCVRLSFITDRRRGSEYLVYRCPGLWTDAASQLATTYLCDGSMSVFFTDTFGVTTTGDFSYKLRVRDVYGNVSEFSSQPVQLTSVVTPEFPSDENLELYWSFDDAGTISESLVSDLSGNNRQGRAVGTPSIPTFAPGRSGSAIRFNNSGHVTIESGREFTLVGKAAVAYSFWTDAISSSRILFHHGTLNDSGLFAEVGNDGSFIVTLWNSAGIDGAATEFDAIFPAGTMTDQLSHYLLILDNSTQRLILYVDGFYGAHIELPGVMKMPATAPVIIGNNSAHTMPLIGRVDEFRIYSEALQAKHARALAQYVVSGTMGNLAAVGTQRYRSAAAPSTLPAPSGLAMAYGDAGALKVQLSWATYVQGDIPANFLVIYWRKGNATTAGPATLEDSSIVVSIPDTPTAGTYVFDALPPETVYSFAIAAGRNTETGVVMGTLQSSWTLPSAGDWLDVNDATSGFAAAPPDFAGSLGGQPSSVLSDTTPPSFSFSSIAPAINTDGTVTVTWDKATDIGSGMEGYNIYRADGQDYSSAMLMATVPDDGSLTYSWTDTDAAHAHQYYYTVRPLDKKRNETVVIAGGWKGVFAYNSLAMSEPKNLVFKAVREKFTLSWDSYSGPLLDEYLIEKSLDSGSTWRGFGYLQKTGITVTITSKPSPGTGRYAAWLLRTAGGSGSWLADGFVVGGLVTLGQGTLTLANAQTDVLITEAGDALLKLESSLPFTTDIWKVPSFIEQRLMARSSSAYFEDPILPTSLSTVLFYPNKTDAVITTVRYKVRAKLTTGSSIYQYANSAKTTTDDAVTSGYVDYALSQTSTNTTPPAAVAVRGSITVTWGGNYTALNAADVEGYELLESSDGGATYPTSLYKGKETSYTFLIPTVVSGDSYEASEITHVFTGRKYRLVAYSRYHDVSLVPYKAVAGSPSAYPTVTGYQTYIPLSASPGTGVVTSLNQTDTNTALGVYIRVVPGTIYVYWKKVITNLADREIDSYTVQFSALGDWTDTVTLPDTSAQSLAYTLPGAVEAAAMSAYRFRVRARTVHGVVSTYYAVMESSNFTDYGTYVPSVPVVSASVGKRDVTLRWDAQPLLTDPAGHLIQISRDGTDWYSPNFAATSDASPWYTGVLGGWSVSIHDTTVTIPYLPITLTVNGLPAVAGESYRFRVRRLTSRYLSSDPTTYADSGPTSPVIVKPITYADLAEQQVAALNLADSSVTTDKLVALAVTAAKLNVSNLTVDTLANVVNLNSGLIFSAYTINVPATEFTVIGMGLVFNAAAKTVTVTDGTWGGDVPVRANLLTFSGSGLLAGNAVADLEVTEISPDGLVLTFGQSTSIVNQTIVAIDCYRKPIAVMDPTTRWGANDYLNYLALGTETNRKSQMRLGNEVQYMFVDPNAVGTEPFFNLYGGDNYFKMLGDGTITLKVTNFQVLSTGNLLFGGDAVIAGRSPELYPLLAGVPLDPDHGALVISTYGQSIDATYIANHFPGEIGFLYHRRKLEFKTGVPLIEFGEESAETHLSVSSTGLTLPEETESITVGAMTPPATAAWAKLCITPRWVTSPIDLAVYVHSSGGPADGGNAQFLGDLATGVPWGIGPTYYGPDSSVTIGDVDYSSGGPKWAATQTLSLVVGGGDPWFISTNLFKLTVRNTQNANAAAFEGVSVASVWWAGSGVQQFAIDSVSGGGAKFYTYSASEWTERMRITSAGNVTIGTGGTNAERLELCSPAATDVALRMWQPGNASSRIGHKASDSNLYISNTYSAWTDFGVAGASITLTNSGNVGIGTTAPASRRLMIRTSVAGNDVGLESTISRVTGTNYGIYAAANGAAATTNVGGFFTASGATGNRGIWISGMAAATVTYAIYSDATAQSYHEGSLGLGVDLPWAKLSIDSGSPLQFRNDSGTANLRRYYWAVGASSVTFSAQNDADAWARNLMAFDHATAKMKVGAASAFTEAINIGGDIAFGATTGDKVSIKYNATELSIDFILN